MWELWAKLTDAQASLISTLVIVIAGGLGVLLSSVLFGGKVKDLQTALDDSLEKINEFQTQVAERLSTADEQLSAALEALGQLRSGVTDLQQSSENSSSDLRDQLKAHWYAIQTALEELASSQKIHGKTRARYSKIPRYTMEELLNALVEDGHMDGRLQDFRAALELWAWHRNGRPPLTSVDVDRMREFAIRIAPTYRPK